jgi:hypothetical protein
MYLDKVETTNLGRREYISYALIIMNKNRNIS